MIYPINCILSTYFKSSNCVDIHSQARQFDLTLEKKWVAHDPYFRLYTTTVRMTDNWKIFSNKDIPHSSMTEFADVLS